MWLRRFERFRTVAGLSDKEEEVTLIYIMGPEADETLRSFHLSKEDETQIIDCIDYVAGIGNTITNSGACASNAFSMGSCLAAGH